MVKAGRFISTEPPGHLTCKQKTVFRLKSAQVAGAAERWGHQGQRKHLVTLCLGSEWGLVRAII